MGAGRDVEARSDRWGFVQRCLASSLTPSASEFGEHVDSEEAGKEHGAEECGLGLFVGFDEEFLQGQVQQGSCSERQDEGQDPGPDLAQEGRGGDGADRREETKARTRQGSLARRQASAGQLDGQREGQEEDLESECDGQDQRLGRSELRAQTDEPSVDEKVDRHCRQEADRNSGCRDVLGGGARARRVPTAVTLCVDPTTVGGEGEDERDTCGEAGGSPAQVALVAQLGQQLPG